MKFAIITHTPHKIVEQKLFAYEPYVREMNLWIKYVSEARVISPISRIAIRSIDSNYKKDKAHHIIIPEINFIGFKNKLISIFKLPIIFFKIFRAMFWADHIHIRCPGNIGLLGCLVQIFFPFKKKTVKYAGNWDPKSKQPLSYRFQKWILANTLLTRNCTVLVYGKWENQTRNIYPFFTASYFENEIEKVEKKPLNKKIQLLYAGAFTKSKQALLSVKTAEELIKKGLDVALNMYGNGAEFKAIKQYIKNANLENQVVLHGNKSKEVLKKAFQEAHFLIFISKSEGWPKVVAEAMFWSCLPISTKVSCVPYMLDYGKRGGLVASELNEIVEKLMCYIENVKVYEKQVFEAKKWSQTVTLEKFELEIKKVVHS